MSDRWTSRFWYGRTLLPSIVITLTPVVLGSLAATVEWLQRNLDGPGKPFVVTEDIVR